uniref:Photosystem I subunit XII n=1 Tax=Synura petersenii TaxID=52555 RepID=A0A3G2QYV2_9STRA|nr:photosystem I subunit XII [Synura petersenii]AYO28185.1 photosystem I subunit XII [Synura petersenii]
MITEFNIYIALFLGFLLLTFSIRLGIALYNSKK